MEHLYVKSSLVILAKSVFRILCRRTKVSVNPWLPLAWVTTNQRLKLIKMCLAVLHSS